MVETSVWQGDFPQNGFIPPYVVAFPLWIQEAPSLSQQPHLCLPFSLENLCAHSACLPGVSHLLAVSQAPGRRCRALVELTLGSQAPLPLAGALKETGVSCWACFPEGNNFTVNGSNNIT